MYLLFPFCIAYLIGSIPFGLILTRLAGLGDIRAIGSGNIGATNVLRTGRKGLALATLLLDGGKGFLAVWFLSEMARFGCNTADNYAPCAPVEAMTAAALVGVVLGHCFPVWLKFKGGKGVATTLGAAFGVDWLLGLCAGAAWLIIAVIFRRSSLAALVAIAGLPGFAWCLGLPPMIINALAFVALLVITRHKTNIRRLLNGTEPKIGRNA